MNLIKSKSSFTLVEILVTIAILAVISTAVLVVINPVEYLKRARDSQRLSDLTNLSKTISWYEADTGGKGFMGTSSIVYVSIPDTTSTCANLGLPPLPSGWSYNCVTSSTLQKTDGTGWIPINFNQLSFGKTLPKLPIDPINTTSSGNYYTYVTGESFKLTSRFESEKLTLQYVANDGGPDPALFEIGANLSLAPFVGGLVGYWSFDEGNGTIAYDRSGYNNHGTLINGPTWQSEANCKVGKCLSFDGVNDYVEIPYNISLDTPQEFTISAWIFDDNCSQWHSINRDFESPPLRIWIIRAQNCNSGNFHIWNNNNQLQQLIPSNSWQKNSWFFFTGTAKVLNNRIIMKYYFNGLKVGELFFIGNQIKTGNMPIRIGAQFVNSTTIKYKKQIIDNFLFYNRALFDSEIKAIYDYIK